MAEKKKKSTSSKKTTKKSSKKGKSINIETSEIIRWAVGFFAFLIILTFFPAINTGIIGAPIANLLKGLFGPMYYAVPFVMLLIAIFWGRDRANNVAGIKYVLYFLDFIFISTLIHTVISDENIAIGTLFKTGMELKSSGFIGGIVAWALLKLMGPALVYTLSILGIFICTVLLCGATPRGTVMAIINFFKNLFAKIKESNEERRARREAEAEEEDDEEEEEEKVVKPAPEPKKKKKEKAFVPALPDDPMEAEAEEAAVSEPEIQTIPETIDESEPFVDEVFEAPAEAAAAEQVEELTLEGPEGVSASETPTGELSFDDDLLIEDDELSLEPIEETPYVFPPISLLTPEDNNSARPSANDVERVSRKLEEVLASFNVRAKVVDCTFGPTVTRYELRPESGVKVKSIMNLSEDLALHLAATSVRIENIPGKSAVGIEIPNKNISMVRLRGLIDNSTFRDNKSRLFAALGEDVAGNPVYLDIAKMPHLLIAGATGQGKSVCINSLILSLLYRNHPSDVKLILIDPKTVEFSDFKDIPHLLVPVINDPKSAAGTLNWACTEMENRYRLIQEVGARDLAGYNTAVSDDPERQKLPQIVIFIDEFADLMMMAPDDVETSVCRLAQKARAAGMHLVIGTQRPSVDVITGLIKANIPSRIALTTFAAVDSRTILDQTGAEKLLGKGDMLYFPVGAVKPIRVQGAFVDGKSEVAAVTQFIKEAAHAQYDESIIKQIEQEAKLCGMKGKKAAAAEPEDDGNEKLDPMFMDAVEVAIESGTVSTSLLQRRLSLGYARAARIIDKMERRGFIGEFDAATKKRNILITPEQFAEMKLNGETKNEDSSNA